MRSRDEINWDTIHSMESKILETLLDIRDLLSKETQIKTQIMFNVDGHDVLIDKTAIERVVKRILSEDKDTKT